MFANHATIGNDPNMQRAIQETVNALADVDRRILALKQGIVQVIPQLAPVLQPQAQQTSGPLAPGFQGAPGITHPFATGFGQTVPNPFLGFGPTPFGVPPGIPQGQPFPGPFTAAPFFGQVPVQAPYGQQGVPQAQGNLSPQQTQGVGVPSFRQF